MHSTTDEHLAAYESGRSVGDQAENGEQIRSLYQALQSVPDGRCKRGRRYPAAVVLTLLLAAKMAGEQTIAGIAQWVDERKELLGQWLPLARTPCANTYRYICAHLDAQAVLAAVSTVLGPDKAATTVGSSPLRHLACDGKELRGSYRLLADGVQAAQGVLGIYDTASGQMEVLLPIENKGFELKAFRTWLTKQKLASCLLTADALHTQSSVCKAVRTAGADYLLIAKRNQRQLNEDIGYLFSRASPEQLLTWVQAHWQIENRSHWRRDVTLGEDRLQLSCKPAALVMAALNCIILALFDRLHYTNCCRAMRSYDAHPDQALALLCRPL
jgi:predicted transposase YbfD/YdcC